MSEKDNNDLEKDRTDWAEDRTLMANERSNSANTCGKATKHRYKPTNVHRFH